jgi:MFS family permease
MGSGRLLNRLGARALILAGFALLAVGYAASAYTGYGLWGFLVATMPVGLGVGVVVSGALRTIAIDEAPLAVRGSAQGLINIFTSIGTLLSATAIGAVADFGGGGASGFGIAYGTVALVMTVMLVIAFGLRKDSAVLAAADTAA